MTTTEIYTRKIKEIELPRNVRFDTVSANQGQMVTESYGGTSRSEHDYGDPYYRRSNSAERTVLFFCRDDAAIRENVWTNEFAKHRDWEASEMIEELVRSGKSEKDAKRIIGQSHIGQILEISSRFTRVI